MNRPSPKEIIEAAYEKKRLESLRGSEDVEANLRSFAHHLAEVISSQGYKEVYTIKFEVLVRGRPPRWEATPELRAWCTENGYGLHTETKRGMMGDLYHTHTITMPKTTTEP